PRIVLVLGSPEATETPSMFARVGRTQPSFGPRFRGESRPDVRRGPRVGFGRPSGFSSCHPVRARGARESATIAARVQRELVFRIRFGVPPSGVSQKVETQSDAVEVFVLMTLYGADLARIQAAAFGDLAERAAPELIALLKASSIPVRRVYDVGCGAGVTTRALVEAGFDTIAVEPSPHLLAIARTAAPAATFLEVSAYDLELRPCEAVLAIGEVLTYHAPDVDADERVRTFFRTVARALAPGGRLVFDLIDADGPPLDAKSWRSEEAWAILWETREDRAAARLTRSIETFCREADG